MRISFEFRAESLNLGWSGGFRSGLSGETQLHNCHKPIARKAFPNLLPACLIHHLWFAINAPIRSRKLKRKWLNFNIFPFGLVTRARFIAQLPFSFQFFVSSFLPLVLLCGNVISEREREEQTKNISRMPPFLRILIKLAFFGFPYSRGRVSWQS